jgi:hypothetical protein
MMHFSSLRVVKCGRSREDYCRTVRSINERLHPLRNGGYDSTVLVDGTEGYSGIVDGFVC